MQGPALWTGHVAHVAPCLAADVPVADKGWEEEDDNKMEKRQEAEPCTHLAAMERQSRNAPDDVQSSLT